MSISFPGESPEYRAARDRLLKQEVELRRATEAVAAVRRALPPISSICFGATLLTICFTANGVCPLLFWQLCCP